MPEMNGPEQAVIQQFGPGAHIETNGPDRYVITVGTQGYAAEFREGRLRFLEP